MIIPVLAIPNTSLPESAATTACRWIGVGSVNSYFLIYCIGVSMWAREEQSSNCTVFIRGSSKPKWANETTGRSTSSPDVLISDVDTWDEKLPGKKRGKYHEFSWSWQRPLRTWPWCQDVPHRSISRRADSRFQNGPKGAAHLLSWSALQLPDYHLNHI